MTAATDLPAQLAHAARRVLIMQRHKAMQRREELSEHVAAAAHDTTRVPEYLPDEVAAIDEDRATVRVRGVL